MSRYRLSHAPNHPLATAAGILFEHRRTLYDAIGVGPHPCHWCGTELHWKLKQGGGSGTLTVDHLDNDGLNNDLSNLVPCCTRCNVARGRPNLIEDNELFLDEPQRRGRVRAEELTCPQCGKRFLVPIAAVKKRRFCSRPCMYLGRPKPTGRPPKRRD